MPEGPSLRMFHGRCCRVLGGVVQRAGGSTRQLPVKQLEGRRLQQSQAHGKCLFLGFGPRSGVPVDPEPASPSGTEVPVDPEPASPSGTWVPVDPEPASPSGTEVPIDPEPASPSGTEVPVDPEPASPSGTWVPVDPEPASPRGTGFPIDTEPQLWLRFHFGLYGSVRCDEFARAKRANKRGDWKDPSPRLVLYFPGDHFLVFYSCRLCVCGGPRTDPHTDILGQDFDKARALCALQLAQPVCYTLMHQRHFSGLGNIIKNEVLYLSGIHPMSLGSQLGIEKLRTLLEQVLLFSNGWLVNKQKGEGLKYHIYQKDWCPKGHAVERAELGPPQGLHRPTWWCPVCQPAVPAAPGPLG
ncbi:endonuclease 8-like 2 [Pristis pectinata]|uniref:endonuclease 8-like 2 n=1 Tax=Pristis pectinata TaxID=685728 RepID=UPI00223D5A49|nr:endonuclease 8-like 2 [Pristis pectinata]